MSSPTTHLLTKLRQQKQDYEKMHSRLMSQIQDYEKMLEEVRKEYNKERSRCEELFEIVRKEGLKSHTSQIKQNIQDYAEILKRRERTFREIFEVLGGQKNVEKELSVVEKFYARIAEKNQTLREVYEQVSMEMEEFYVEKLGSIDFKEQAKTWKLFEKIFRDSLNGRKNLEKAKKIFKVAEKEHDHQMRIVEEFNEFCAEKLEGVDPKEAAEIIQIHFKNHEGPSEPKRARKSNFEEGGPSTSTNFENQQDLENESSSTI